MKKKRFFHLSMGIGSKKKEPSENIFPTAPFF